MKKTIATLAIMFSASVNAFSIDEAVKIHIPSASKTKVLLTQKLSNPDGSITYIIAHQSVVLTAVNVKDKKIKHSVDVSEWQEILDKKVEEDKKALLNEADKLLGNNKNQ